MARSKKQVLLDYVPPAAARAAWDVLSRLRAPAFEMVGYAWPETEPASQGWSAEGVAAARVRQWEALKTSLANSEAFGISRQDLEHPWHLDESTQSINLAFGYALARAAAERAAEGDATLRVLDWGGEIGSYHELARTLLPGVRFEWHCAELPAMVALGRRVNPVVVFHEDGGWAGSDFDFVFSSSSLQYLPDWRKTVRSLVACARGPIFVTRLPFVQRSRSFVALQRVPEYGTAYHGWIFNRDEFTQAFEDAGALLDRAFVNHVGPRIKGAPEQNVYMGFLFRAPERSADSDVQLP